MMQFKLHKVKKQWVVLATVVGGLGIGYQIHTPHAHMAKTVSVYHPNAFNVATMQPPKAFTKYSQYYDKFDRKHHINSHLVMLTKAVKGYSTHRILNAKSIQTKGNTVRLKVKQHQIKVGVSQLVPAAYTHAELVKLAHGTNFKSLLIVPTKQLSVYQNLSMHGKKTKIMRQNGFMIKGIQYYHGVPRFELVGGGYLSAQRNDVKVFNLKSVAKASKSSVSSPQVNGVMITPTQSAMDHASSTTHSMASNMIQSNVSAVATSMAQSLSQNQTKVDVKALNQQISNTASSAANSTVHAIADSTAQLVATSTASVLSSTAALSLPLSNTTSAKSIAVSMTSSVASSVAQSTAQSIADTTTSSTTTSIAQSIADDHLGDMFNVTSATLDKARYLPNSMVTFNFVANNPTNESIKGGAQLKIYQENQLVKTITTPVTLGANDNQSYQLTWQTPNQDYTGYHAEISVNGDVKKVLGIDVSSDVSKFPRYGAVTQFTPNTNNDTILNQMKDLSINNLEYYDAYQNPQNPMNTDNLLGNYTQDWATWLSDANKTKSGQVIKNTIDTAHQYNMQSMLYNMIYAITGDATNSDYLKSIGVKPEWLLYRADGPHKDQLFQFHMTDTNDPNYAKATQTYLDIKNPEVVDWIVNRMKPILEQMNFDGWHGDTIGDNALMYSKNADGSIKNEYHVGDELGDFANQVKQRLGNKKFVVNTVSGYGEDQVANSQTDFDYSETWTGTYLDVVNEIKRVATNSNKSLVIPGYLQEEYAKTHPGATFNPNAVLLFDAMVYGAGGSRMELVDGNKLLVSEFFPNQDLSMSTDLQQQMLNYQTFITAYENLLRDGQRDNGNEVAVYNQSNQNVASNNASPNSVYAYSRSSNNSQTIQLVNMLGVTSDKWQDNDSSRQQPTELDNFQVKYRPSGDYQMGGTKQVKNVYLATPDGSNANQSIAVPFKWEHDDKGYYLSITVPKLQRWDMLYLK